MTRTLHRRASSPTNYSILSLSRNNIEMTTPPRRMQAQTNTQRRFDKYTPTHVNCTHWKLLPQAEKGQKQAEVSRREYPPLAKTHKSHSKQTQLPLRPDHGVEVNHKGRVGPEGGDLLRRILAQWLKRRTERWVTGGAMQPLLLLLLQPASQPRS